MPAWIFIPIYQYSLHGLVYLWIPLPFLVLVGTERCDQGGIHDRALGHRHRSLAEMGFVGLKNLLAQLVLLQQVAEGQNRSLIGDQLDAGKAAHCGHLDQGLFHGRIAERIALLQQADPQHRGQWVLGASAFLARLGVVGLDQREQRMPEHDRHTISERNFSRLVCFLAVVSS